MTKKDMKFLQCLHFEIFENDQEEKRFTGNHSFPDDASQARNVHNLEYRQQRKVTLEEVLDSYAKHITD